MQAPKLIEMLKNGVHFGHQTSKWHPKMIPYIFGIRNGIHIIDLEKTSKCLEEAVVFISKVLENNGRILFVGTKRQASEIIEKNAQLCRMPYVNKRWLGGTVTNFSIIYKLIKKYKDLKHKRDNKKLLKYTKKERLNFDREIERLDGLVGGIETLDKLPDAIFILDIKKEKNALKEAKTKGIPVIAICDTNVDPTNVAYPIPANDDATRSIACITEYISRVIVEKTKNNNVVKVKKQEKQAPQEEVSSLDILKAKILKNTVEEKK